MLASPSTGGAAIFTLIASSRTSTMAFSLEPGLARMLMHISPDLFRNAALFGSFRLLDPAEAESMGFSFCATLVIQF